MDRIRYLCLHCTSTPPGMRVSRGDLEMWHMGPMSLDNGRVKWKKRIYPSRESLKKLYPDETIGGVHVSEVYGRDWNRLGYSDIIHREGPSENLTPYNDNIFIENHEMTWGAAGINSVSRHVVLEGGWHDGIKEGIWSFDMLYTTNQFQKVVHFINENLKLYPWIKIIGHNQVSGKTCPNFRVNPFLDMVAVHKRNQMETP